jgi:putative endonuclease
MKSNLIIGGRTVFLLECADGSLFAGWSEDLRKSLRKIRAGKGFYFNNHPERLPVKVVFREDYLPFDEAYMKYRYLRIMNRTQRLRMLRTKCWPVSKYLVKPLEKDV